MNPAYKIAFAAVAVLVAAIVGYNMFARTPGPGGTPTSAPSAQPTAAPTAQPTPTPPPIPADGSPISPGRYAVAIPGADLKAEVTVSGDWVGWEWFISRSEGSISFWTVSNVGTDVCAAFASAPNPPIGESVDDLVAALDAQVNSDMTVPVDVTVGGYEGKRVELRLSSALPENCSDPKVWWLSQGTQGRGGDPGDPNSDAVYILDVDGQRVVIVVYPSSSVTGGPVADAIASIGFARP